MAKILTRLEEAGLKVNAGKSFFAKPELEYLGYWITRQGIQPLPHKVEAIKNLAPPKNRRQLRRFIGLINYYRDMWAKRSELLAPLSKLTSDKNKWQWTSVRSDVANLELCKMIFAHSSTLSLYL